MIGCSEAIYFAVVTWLSLRGQRSVSMLGVSLCHN